MLEYSDRKSLFTPSLYVKKQILPEKMIVSWQRGFAKVLEDVFSGFDKTFTFDFSNVWVKGNLSFSLIPPGSPYAALFMEEMKERGVREFLFLGSCGVLGKTETESLIVPDRALRDEGTSYHYISSKDEFIEISSSSELCGKLDVLNMPYTKGAVWTTDAVFRETEEAVNKALKKGCICVDMECSALEAVSNYLKTKACHLFFTVDRLDGAWDKGRIFSMKKEDYLSYLKLALSLIS